MDSHHMRIQEPTLGDDHITWDPENEKEVAAARKKFDAAIKKGKRAFKVENKAKAGEPITEFDPALKEILIVAPLGGG